ncbi:MAG: bifunctional biotin--[acetyl-CoA-carboxylase] ligase/biotin operon repressor BirA [Candidatus Thiodiazotropha sp. 6PLUC2]
MSDNFDLVKIMADGRFHSGEELGAKLGVSRAAVWKKLQLVKDRYLLGIDAVKGKGYRLSESLDLLDREKIIERLQQSNPGTLPSLNIHTTIDSTNSWLMQQAALGIESGSVCLAEQQNGGRGRHGRQWVSPFGRNLYFSMLFRFDLAPTQVAGLSLASAIGVLRLLRQLNCYQAGLKWPNDILWQGKKLAGLLLEVSGETSGPSQVVVGVGLNVGMGSLGEEIDQPWSDLREIPEIVACSRSELAASLTIHLSDIAEQYRAEGLRSFIDEWHASDLFMGKEVVIRSANRAQNGQHLGIDDSGGILIRIEGEPRCFHAGEVSLRRAG